MRKIKLVNEENKKTPKSQLDFFAGGFFFDRVDKDTGEVYWNKDEEVERIYRACGWKNLRVTYAAFEDGGCILETDDLLSKGEVETDCHEVRPSGRNL